MNTKNIKPFDLQAALNGEPVMLRDGRKAFVRHHETELNVAVVFRLTGFVLSKDESISPINWSRHGEHGGKLDEQDIISMYPKTRIINGFEVPAPEVVEPNRGDLYFVARPSFKDFYESYTWRNDSVDTRYMERGLAFLTEEDAIANSKAMVGINPY